MGCCTVEGCGGMRRNEREKQNRPRKHGVNTVIFTIFLGIIRRRDAAGCGGMRRDAAACGGMQRKWRDKKMGRDTAGTSRIYIYILDYMSTDSTTFLC